MDSLEELKTALETTGYIVEYRNYNVDDDGNDLPFPQIFYYIDDTELIYAEDMIALKEHKVVVQLWTVGKDDTAQAKVETALNQDYTDQSESYDNDAELYCYKYVLWITEVVNDVI